MKKAKTVLKPYNTNDDVPILEEPYVSYPSLKRLPAVVSDFSYNKFQKIANKVPFTLADWASILHLSERTLQRYAKDNKNFEGIYVDRILQLEKLITLGLSIFEDATSFYKWLKQNKQIMGEEIGFDAIYDTDGISKITDQLGRIQQGVYA